jgi:hypothetical protein
MTVDAVMIYLAIILAGCVVVSIADSFAAHEVDTRLRISGAAAIFTQVGRAVSLDMSGQGAPRCLGAWYCPSLTALQHLRGRHLSAVVRCSSHLHAGGLAGRQQAVSFLGMSGRVVSMYSMPSADSFAAHEWCLTRLRISGAAAFTQAGLAGSQCLLAIRLSGHVEQGRLDE